MKTPVMLITYADTLGGSLPALHNALSTHFAGAVGAVHLLPFFPSSGDRGFAPLCYSKVAPEFGAWQDVAAIAEGRGMMYDFMVNHLSRQSPEFQNFLQKHDGSQYRDLFLRFKHFWPGGEPTPRQVESLYRRKPGAPCVQVEFADGDSEKIWCTFGPEQMDLDTQSETTRQFIRQSLQGLVARGATTIRLDAFAFAIKKLGTDCFFIEPEIWQLLEHCRQSVPGTPLLLEMHGDYTVQQRLAEKGYAVYDFALPMLMLHALYNGRADRLKHWFEICPRNCHTTLDTHDGIGVPDVAGLLTREEMNGTIETLLAHGANVKWMYREGSNENSLEHAYQMNATFYSALGCEDDAYLMARAIQFFAPGTPQVYYVGMLAGENDTERFAATGLLTDINRHGYTEKEIEAAVRRPVVQRLLALMRLRNHFDAFDGDFQLVPSPGHILHIRRTQGGKAAELKANLATKQFEIRCRENGNEIAPPFWGV